MGMALLSDLVAALAARGVDSPATLGLFARRLREAGRISKAGRGRSAAKMTYLDAARFTIACLATDHPERAAVAEQFFSSFVYDPDISMIRQPEAFTLPVVRGITFDAALARLLEEVASGHVRPSHGFFLNVERSGASSSIEENGNHFAFVNPAGLIEPPFKSAKNIRATLFGRDVDFIAGLIGGEARS